jgi:hypothetical protein
MVLITTREADNVRRAQKAGIDEIVWISEIECELGAAFRRVQCQTSLLSLAEVVKQNKNLSPELKHALGCLFEAKQPVRTICELANLAGCHRTTLWRHWNDLNCARLRLQDVIDWTLLVHAISLKRPYRKWSAVSEALQLHQHTLNRIAQRRIGARLSAVRRPVAQIAAMQDGVEQLMTALSSDDRSANVCGVSVVQDSNGR